MHTSNDIYSLIDRHKQLIERLCIRASFGDVAQCAAMIQDCYLSLWQHLDTLRPGATDKETKAWVTWRCRGAISHYLRQQRHWQSLDTLPDSALTVHGDWAYSELLEEVAARLKPHERQLLQLMIDGYNTGEIATRLRLDPENVKTRRRRLLEQLRTIISEIEKSY